MWVYKHLYQIFAFKSFVYISRSGIAGSNNNSVFNFLMIHHTDLHSKYTILPMGFLCFVILPIFPQQPAWRASSPSWAWSLRRHTQYDWQPSMARVWARSVQPPSSRLSQSVSKASCPASPPHPLLLGAAGNPELSHHCLDDSFLSFRSLCSRWSHLLVLWPSVMTDAKSLYPFSRAWWHCHSSWSSL